MSAHSILQGFRTSLANINTDICKVMFKGHPNNQEWNISPMDQGLDYFKDFGQFLNFHTVLGCFPFLPHWSKNFLSTNMSL